MKIIDQLALLRTDNKSGALELLEKLLDVLERTLTRTSLDEGGMDALLSSIRQIGRDHDQLTIMHHFIDLLPSAVSRTELLALVKDYRKTWAHVDEDIASEFLEKVDLNDKIVLLHSNSQTVTRLFQQAKKRNISCSIIQTESRPVLEGRRQASKIAALGFPVILIADAAITRYLPRIDIAVLGADRLGNDHFVNKIGSYSIALACQEELKPVYVLADERKKSNRSIREEMKPGSELWSKAKEGVEVENYYFESTPAHLVTAFFHGRLAATST